MDWKTFIIPVIGLAVWLLAQMMGREVNKRPTRTPPPKPPEEEPSAQSGPRWQRPAPPAPPAEPAPRPQQTSAELERFLREVRRRQQAATPKPREVEVSRPQPTPRPVVLAPAPVRPVQAAEPPRPRPTVIPEALPAPTSTLPTQTLPVLSAPPAPTTVSAPTSRPSSIAARQVRALVQSRHSLAAALVLREIFDKPLSRRPRRR
jgi:hypothetical protein